MCIRDSLAQPGGQVNGGVGVVAQLLGPQPAQLGQAHTTAAVAGQQWDVDGVTAGVQQPAQLLELAR